MSQNGVDSLDGSDSGCSLGWECIDSADVTEIDSQAKADPLAETPLRDQVFAHCPERLPSSDDGFCLVASEGTLPMAHRLTETPTPTLSSEVSPSKSLLEVPIECSPSPNMHSVEHDTAGITAATAGVAELSLGPHDMMNDQAEASLDTVPVARAESETTMKPSHIPASLPGLGTKRAAPQGALRTLRTRLNPNCTSVQNAETKIETPPATLGGYPPSGAVQQGSPGMSQLRRRRQQQQLQQQQHLLHSGCCTQHCAGKLQQWHPFVDSQQQQQPGGQATYTQQQSLAALQHQNAMLQNQQKQLQQEIASLKLEKGWPDNISWPQADASRGQTSTLTGREAFHNLQDNNAIATAAAGQSGSSGSERQQRVRERYARESYAREVEQEEERMLQAALKASLEPTTQPAAQEHWQKDNMMVDEEDAVITKLQRRTADSLPIRHGTGVVWQNDPNSNSSEKGNKLSDGSAAASKWLSGMCPKTHDSSARIGTLRAAETLHQFAKRHFCDVKATATINGLQTKLDDVAPAPVLYPGQILQLPCKDSYVEVGTSARLGAQVAKVGKTGTIEALAEQHGVYVSSVLVVNGLPANPVVRCGQMLQMP